jgi:hypothetical protein
MVLRNDNITSIMQMIRLFLLSALLLSATNAFAKGSGGRSAAHKAPVHSNKCGACARDEKGRIARSKAAVRAFIKANPRPGPAKDWVIDHIVPLKEGGADSPENMQWQTVAAAKAKDKIE